MPTKKLLLLLSIILFAIFIFYSYLVAKERFIKLDFDTTVRIQDHIPHKFDYPFSILSILGTAEITGVVWLLFLVLALFKRYWLSALSLFLLPLALAIEVYGKLFVFHPAPPHLFYRGVIQFHFPSEYVHTNYSYPSGHVTRTTFLLTTLMVFFFFKAPKKYQIFIQPTLAIGLFAMIVSRIYLGEHWTTDVVGGLLVGSAFGIIPGLLLPMKKKISYYTSHESDSYHDS